jgi:hypothetical protein
MFVTVGTSLLAANAGLSGRRHRLQPLGYAIDEVPRKQNSASLNRP